MIFLPDKARVCLPPAATVAIRTPVFRVTRHGKDERLSSPGEELSAAFFADETLLRFEVSSPPTLVSFPEPVPPLDREP